MPFMAASVSTLVVSWKEAADRKDSVARRPWLFQGALVLRKPADRLHLLFFRFSFEFKDIHQASRQHIRISGILYSYLAEHLSYNNLNMLVVDINAL